MQAKTNRFIYFQAQALRKEPVKSAYKDLASTTRYSKNQLIEIQKKRLYELIKFAIENIEFYQVHYKQFVSQIKNSNYQEVFELFDLLPELKKKDAISNYDLLKAPNEFRTTSNISSGTTGDPFEFPCDNIAWAYRHASLFRYLSLFDIAIGEPYGYFTGQHWRNEIKIKTKIKDAFFNRVRLSAFAINEKDVEVAYTNLKSIKATYIYGYGSTVVDFIIIAEALKLDLKALELKAIICTGETLSQERKAFIKTAFGSTVGNYYGSADGGFGSFEGIDGIMYENMESCYLWIGKDSVIRKTDLFLRQMPLIKLNMGDVMEPFVGENANAQLNHRQLGGISGRVGEKVKLPNGRQIHPMIFNYFFDLFTKDRYVRKFRFLIGKTSVTLLIVPLIADIPEKFLMTTQLELEKVFDGNKISIKIVANIPVLANGKHRDWAYIKEE